MTDNTIALTSVGGIDASSVKSPEVLSIDPVPAGNVLVEGTVEDGDKLVTCTLTQPGWSQTLFVLADGGGNWSARFDEVPPGTYLLSCCAAGEGRVCAEFQVPDYKPGGTQTTLMISNVETSSRKATVHGTVTNSGNSVCCALTPMPSGTPVMKSVTAAGSNWTVVFDSMEAGSYAFTATAALEASTGTGVMIPP
jgi:hypothetical protein